MARTALPPVLAAAALVIPAAAPPAVLPAAAAAASGQAGTARGDDIGSRLKAVPGLKVVSKKREGGYTDYTLTITQPIDHRNPAKGTFKQRLVLQHRSAKAPMVMYTGGYGESGHPSLSEPAAILSANQLSVEHRFFGTSFPERKDWSKLDIWQEASDEHAIVEALTPVYGGAWIATGGSKGGMTAVYHRRFYPDDLDGVVAYVAPNDAVNGEDGAYERFFATVGTPSCRAALRTAQREALKRRTRLVPRLRAYAKRKHFTFGRYLGSADRSFEMSVLDSVWTFWQYFGAEECGSIPRRSASDKAIFDWVGRIQDWSQYTDQGVRPYVGYYYQAARQLGWASPRFAHLKGLTRHPGLYQPNSMLPASLRSSYDGAAMRDVDRWVTNEATQMMFVYGGRDPWSAERFTPEAADTYVFTATTGNHSTEIATLSSRDRRTATAALRGWAGLT
ncbi:S28 family serine protease [Microbispora sp. NPDC049125]|uniref:S28 family serine protease n=1 Tax=Microbispora sp. NPDC049125 TaxID=3154929 RepID=UPI00346636D7